MTTLGIVAVVLLGLCVASWFGDTAAGGGEGGGDGGQSGGAEGGADGAQAGGTDDGGGTSGRDAIRGRISDAASTWG